MFPWAASEPKLTPQGPKNKIYPFMIFPYYNLFKKKMQLLHFTS